MGSLSFLAEDVLSIGQAVQQLPDACQDGVYWLEGYVYVGYSLAVLLPGFPIFVSALGIITVGSMQQQNEQVDGVEVASGLGPTW